MFRECDWRGRRLLFDSNAIEPVTIPPSSLSSSTTTTNQTSNTALNVTQSSKPSPLKLDKNHIEYYEGKPYKVCKLK